VAARKGEASTSLKAFPEKKREPSAFFFSFAMSKEKKKKETFMEIEEKEKAASHLLAPSLSGAGGKGGGN